MSLKIALWNATDVLRNNAAKLNEEEYSILEVQDDKLNVDEFDYILIPFENFRQTKAGIINKFGGVESKVYTFEEFWVKDCEKNIADQYYRLWKKTYEAGIRTFDNRVVIITGGGSGIGRECAKAFAFAGAKVIVAGRTKEKLEAVCSELQAQGKKCQFMVWNIDNITEFDTKIREAETLYDRPVDILVNNAGIWEGTDFFSVTEETFDRIMNTNLKATYFLCQSFAGYLMQKKRKGHIVNVISNTGFLPTVKPYGLAKWGMVGLTRGLGLHLAEYGITVNGVAPGGVATELSGWKKGDCPARRSAKNGRVSFPCEVAQTILHLAGFTGENMNGEIIVCDGGDKTINMRL